MKYKYIVIEENIYLVLSKKYDMIIQKHKEPKSSEAHNAMLNELIANANLCVPLTNIFNFE